MVQSAGFQSPRVDEACVWFCIAFSIVLADIVLQWQELSQAIVPPLPRSRRQRDRLGPNNSAAKSFMLLLIGPFPTSMRDRTGQRNSAREGSDEK